MGVVDATIGSGLFVHKISLRIKRQMLCLNTWMSIQNYAVKVPIHLLNLHSWKNGLVRSERPWDVINSLSYSGNGLLSFASTSTMIAQCQFLLITELRFITIIIAVKLPLANVSFWPFGWGRQRQLCGPPVPESGFGRLAALEKREWQKCRAATLASSKPNKFECLLSRHIFCNWWIHSFGQNLFFWRSTLWGTWI